MNFSTSISMASSSGQYIVNPAPLLATSHDFSISVTFTYFYSYAPCILFPLNLGMPISSPGKPIWLIIYEGGQKLKFMDTWIVPFQPHRSLFLLQPPEMAKHLAHRSMLDSTGSSLAQHHHVFLERNCTCLPSCLAFSWEDVNIPLNLEHEFFIFALNWPHCERQILLSLNAFSVSIGLCDTLVAAGRTA